MYDENIAYAVLDNHKFGDYNPYVYKTIDGGITWTKDSITYSDTGLINSC